MARSIKKKIGKQVKIQDNKCPYLFHEETCWIIHRVYINQIYKIYGLTNSASMSVTPEK